ncbi:holo-ACP synthase [Pseudonocardia sp. TRM90224]|uniref:holo-ACP synthase n=1 Tax=Pseudonocardia sp. TRM90224 TaxID=2812678 RepID=UPI001E582B45|nr:4'-phosphopantetheinyl transferase superfamily protein [Pseudonocardia sp. TRM90224]
MTSAEVRDLLVDALGLDGLPGVGVDTEDVARWATPDPRLFTAEEHRHCTSLGRPAEGYAGRWCAKEAVVKAVSPYAPATMRDVEIVAAPDGRPLVVLAQRLAEMGIAATVSIAHSSTVAVAVAVARAGTTP